MSRPFSLFVLSLVSTLSSAAVFTTFGPGYSYQSPASDPGLHTERNIGANIRENWLIEFSTTIESLDQISIAWQAVQATSLRVNIWIPVPGDPFDTLAAFYFFNVPAGFSGVLHSGPVNQLLPASPTYLMEVRNIDDNTTGAWLMNDQNLTGTRFHQQNLQITQDTGTLPAFELLGSTSVPEPWSFALTAAGLAAIAVRRIRAQ